MVNETKSLLMSFGEAIELAKTGVPIASVNMRVDELVCLTEGKLVETDELWNIHNRAAANNNGGELWVQPYFLLTNSFSTVPYAFSNIDIFANWMKADVKCLPTKVKFVDDIDLELFGKHADKPEAGYTIEFNYVEIGSTEHHISPFWILFDYPKLMRTPKVVITKAKGSVLGNMINDLMEYHQHRSSGGATYVRKFSELSNSVNELIITDEMSLKEASELIKEASTKHFDTISFIIDVDAFGDTGSVSDYLTNTINTMDDRKDVVFNISLKEHLGK